MVLPNLLSLIAVLTVIVGLSGCGKPEEYRFESRELTPEEIQKLGYAQTMGASTGSELTQGISTMPTYRAAPAGTPAALINAFAGTVQKLLSPGDSQMAATLIGQALPRGVSAFQLSRAQTGTHVYEKKLKSILGFNVLTVHYKIGFQFDAKYRGKGAYLTNVKFVPLSMSTDPLWSLRATSLSEEPINLGSSADPVAKLGFAVTFTAHGPGTRTVTDEFELNGKSGDLAATIREF